MKFLTGAWQKHNYVLGLVFIFCTVLLLGIYSSQHPFSAPPQSRQDASGLDYQFAHKFVYFYYHTGQFPLVTLNEQVVNSRQGAYDEIRNHGNDLLMEYGHWSRLGESARIWTFMPDAWVFKKITNPSVRLFNILFFTLGLLSFYHGLYRLGYKKIAWILILLLLSLPFFHYEVFSRENIFGLQASAFCLLAGILFSTFYCKTTHWKLIFGLISAAACLSLVAEIRNENLVLVVSALLLIWGASTRPRTLRLLASLVLVVLFFSGRWLIQSYFQQRFQAAYTLVERQGGHLYQGPRISGHKFWHPVFCGLGDFDTKYGYRWSDTTAYNYAITPLRRRGIHWPYSGKLHFDAWYDSAHRYYIKFDEVSQYEEVVKEKVIQDIRKDPWWYLSILTQRLFRILHSCLPFANAGFLVFPVLYMLRRKKDLSLFYLILASAVPCGLALLIYAKDGATLNSLYAVIALSILLSFALDLLTRRWQPGTPARHYQ